MSEADETLAREQGPSPLADDGPGAYRPLMEVHDGLVPLRITFDPVSDAAYVHLQSTIAAGAAVKTVSVDVEEVGMVNLDFDEGGHLLGVEVVGARAVLPREVLAQVDAQAQGPDVGTSARPL